MLYVTGGQTLVGRAHTPGRGVECGGAKGQGQRSTTESSISFRNPRVRNAVALGAEAVRVREGEREREESERGKVEIHSRFLFCFEFANDLHKKWLLPHDA